MKKFAAITAIVLNTIFVSGCAQSAQNDDIRKSDESASNMEDHSGHFKNHYLDAGRFLDFMHEGDAFQKEGKYDEAINAYNKGLEIHAYSRPEQTRALESIAQSYEKKGDLKKAADNYELASECTMNADRKVSLKSKAGSLRTVK